MLELDLTLASEGDDDIRCKLCRSRFRPFSGLLGKLASVGVGEDDRSRSGGISPKGVCTMASIDGMAASAMFIVVMIVLVVLALVVERDRPRETLF